MENGLYNKFLSPSTNASPIALRLRNERLIQIEISEHSLQISDDKHTIQLEGAFAHAIERFIQHGEKTPLLNRIEASNSWLIGLSKATQVESADGQLLLGDGLGMLFIEVTSRCNERCIHCYADSSPERNEFLSLNDIKSVLEQAKELGHPFIQFTGGDPLIHPDIVAATEHAHSLGLTDIEIYTNGLLLHAPLLAELSSPFKPRFCFSLYSHDEAVHDAITRVPGSLARTLSAIRRVQASGLEVRIGIALMQVNAESLPETLTFLNDEFNIPTHFIRIDPINTAGRGGDVAAAENIRIEHATAPHTPDLNNNHEQRLGKLCVDASGDVHPCIFSRNITLGNINNSSLKQMINHLNQSNATAPSAKRWQACKAQLSCHDCRLIAYHLGV